MTSTLISPAGQLFGSVRPPGDKSISHRSLLLAARAEGTSVLKHLSRGDDVRRTADAVAALGADVDRGPTGEVRVTGGASRLHEPDTVIDLGNSGTSMRLLTGYVASFPWMTVMTGDESLRSRPMGRVVRPLREMGAHIHGRRGGELAPVVVRGNDLHGVDHHPAVASAQVKGAVLLAGMSAEGVTRVHERVPTRMHTEELLSLAGGDVSVHPEDGGGHVVEVRPSDLHRFELEVPADPSQAAFMIVAGCIVPDSEVVCEGVYLGPGRTGFLDVLERMGARIERRYRDATSGDIVARYGPLRGTDVSGAEVPGLIDEVPALAVAAAFAEGTSTFCDVGELRVKESDRITTMRTLIEYLGGQAEETADTLSISGIGAGRRLRGKARVSSFGDHRVAMAAAVAALASEEAVEVTGWDCVATSYPGFVGDLIGLVVTSGPGGDA
jgi:3-phosphoshikimate 1-carboxyvinyltransferase